MSISPYGMATGKAQGLKGTGYKQVTMPNFTPEQMQLFQSLFGQLGPDSYLGKLAGGDQSGFEQAEAPALKQFAGLQGGLASRFSGMGSGARHSSGHQLAQTSAAQDFAGQLQGNRMNLQRQALQDLMSMSNSLLNQRPNENILAQKEMPLWKQLLLGLNQAGSQFAGSMAGKAAGGAMF